MSVGMQIINNTNIGSANMSATTAQIVAANEARKMLIITNDSDTTVYINFGADAVANQGIRLNANGGAVSFTEGDIHLSLAVNGITASGSSKRVTYLEGY